MTMLRRTSTAVLALLLLVSTVAAFTTCNNNKNAFQTQLNAKQQHNHHVATFVASALLIASTTLPVLADEYGVETEAPTLFTGETVMICKKRGPLGACVEQVPRTPENDNDKASKYFREPTVKSRAVLSEEDVADTDTNALIQKLRQQTDENREKNEQAVKTQTAINDQSASFGPFDRSVVILNTDGKTFTVLENPQAMRLKKAGFIQDRRFVKQPTAEELEEALESEGGFFGGLVKGIFGSGDDE